MNNAVAPAVPPPTESKIVPQDDGPPEIFTDMALRETRFDEIRRVYQVIRRWRGDKTGRPMFLPAKIHYRVLRVLPDSIRVICIEDPAATEEERSRDVIEELLASQAWVVAEREPLDVLRTPEGQLTDKQIRCRERNVGIIQPLMELWDDIFDWDKRARVIGKICEAKNLQPVQVGRILRRYLQGGRREQALCGRWYIRSQGSHRGVRLAGNDEVPLPIFVRAGRPRNDGYSPYRVRELDVKKIQRAALKYYHTPEGGEWTCAWHHCLGEGYMDLDFCSSVPLKIQVAQHKASDFPSKTQFKYWALKDRRISRLLERRLGKRSFNLTHRRLTSKSEINAIGPGYYYQIDPTPLDVIVVHRLTRRPIGKIILYLVVDVFSHAIVGFYVHVGNAGFDPACLAVLSAAEDKVELCQALDISLVPGEWPMACLCGGLIADSELASLRAHGLVDKKLLSLRIVPAYRADLKGLVEALLGTAARRAKHLPGYSKGGRPRAKESPEVTAMLDYREVSQVVVGWIRRHNNRVMTTYAPTPGMIADGVVLTPVNIWNWGVENCGGARRKWDMETLRKLCLPTAKAIVTRRGLERKGLVYEPSPGLMPEFKGWCEQRPDGHEIEAEIIYHPADSSEAWLLHEGRSIRLQLTQVSQAQMHWTEEEIEGQKFETGLANANYASTNTPLDAAVQAQEAHIVEKATEKTIGARGNARKRRREKLDKPAERSDQQKKIRGEKGPPLPQPSTQPNEILDEEEQEILRQLENDITSKSDEDCA